MDSLNDKLNNFIGNKVTRNVLPDGSVETCDLVTGECKIIKYKDGLIERDDSRVNRRTVNVETMKGEIKNLLND